MSLNVSLQDTARAATSLEVTISQAGQTAVGATLSVPTMPVDGGAVSKSSFYERIKLPSAYTEGQAQVSVVAKQGASNLATAQAVIEVEPEGAVAGYVTLGEKVPPPPADAGTGDAG